MWDGDPDCAHEWGNIESKRQTRNHLNKNFNERWGHGGGQKKQEKQYEGNESSSQFCVHCSAWLGCLGLEPTPELYVAHLVQIFAEVKRVLRDDGTLWLNIGDSYAGGNRGGNPDDSPFRKQATNKGSLVPPTPIPPGSVLKPKDMVLIPFRLALALQADGWWLRSTIIWHKPNCMPSSVKDRPTTDFEYVFLLAKSKKYYYDADAIREPNANPKRTNYTPGKRAYAEGNTEQCNDTRTRRNDGFEAYANGKVCNGRNKRTVWKVSTLPYKDAHFATFPPKLIEPMILAGSAEKACEHCGTAWTRVTKKVEFGRADTDSKLEDGIHERSGAKSLATKRQAYRAAGLESPPFPITIGWQPSCDCPDNNGTGASVVFDPFAGSGTTLAEAKRHGRHYCGIEANPEYVMMIEKRIAETTKAQLKLDFGGAE